jgi:hypothetical protein
VTSKEARCWSCQSRECWDRPHASKPVTLSKVDVVLTKLSEKLDWRSSIVDLMLFKRCSHNEYLVAQAGHAKSGAERRQSIERSLALKGDPVASISRLPCIGMPPRQRGWARKRQHRRRSSQLRRQARSDQAIAADTVVDLACNYTLRLPANAWYATSTTMDPKTATIIL